MERAVLFYSVQCPSLLFGQWPGTFTFIDTNTAMRTAGEPLKKKTQAHPKSAVQSKLQRSLMFHRENIYHLARYCPRQADLGLREILTS